MTDKNENGLTFAQRLILAVVAGAFIVCAGIVGVGEIWQSIMGKSDNPGDSVEESNIRTQVALELTQTALVLFTPEPDGEPETGTDSTRESTATSFPTNTPQSADNSPNPVPSPTSPRNPLHSALDNMLGSENWSCLPGWPNAIGIRQLPPNFVVTDPIVQINNDNGEYSTGETIAGELPATGWLSRSLPDNPCSVSRPHITRANLDDLFGSGNWYCLSGFGEGIYVNSIPSDYSVGEFVSSVDQWDVKYFQGEAVPSGSPATVWLQNYFPQEECP